MSAVYINEYTVAVLLSIQLTNDEVKEQNQGELVDRGHIQSQINISTCTQP